MVQYSALVTFLSGAITFGIVQFIWHTFERSSFYLTRKSRFKLQKILQEAQNSREKELDDLELKREQLSRNEQFFGPQGQSLVEKAFVIVVGVGGVGSHAAHFLARSGVKKLRLIDFDQLTLSSLNRHAVAKRQDVGLPKVSVLKDHLQQVAPWCEIDARNCVFTRNTASKLLEGSPDYVLDCIDDVKTKIELLSYCCENSIKVSSSMGAGAKADPTRIKIVSLDDIVEDPLASRIRWQLAKVPSGDKIKQVNAVFSVEKPHMKLLPLDLEDGNLEPSDFGAMPNFRVRIIPVLGTMPALFGISLAAFVISHLAKQPFEPAGYPSMTDKACHRLHQRFRIRRKKRFPEKYSDDVLDVEDIDFILIQFKRRCCITHTKWNRSSGFELAQWSFNKPIDVGNVVLVKKPYATLLDGLVLQKQLPTPEALGISRDHFEAIVLKLKLMEKWNPSPKSFERMLL